jgi:hypothetical protein
MNSRFLACILISVSITLCCQNGNALERVIALPNMGDGDHNKNYTYRLLVATLDATREKFGPYELVTPARSMSSQRVMAELKVGTKLSVAVSPFKSEWEGQTLVVPVPIEGGIASYRLFVAKKSQEHQFQHINCLKELKEFKYGLGVGWSTAKILEGQNFNIVYSPRNESLLRMLSRAL